LGTRGVPQGGVGTLPATLALGVLGRPHGVRGEVVFHSFNPSGTQIEELELPLAVELRRGSESRTAAVIAARPFKAGSLLRLEGVATRDDAAAVTGHELRVPRAVLPPLAKDECYIEDLVGCAVFDLDGKSRGRVVGAFWNGTHDVLTVVDESGSELLVPVVPDFLIRIDATERRLVVDPHE
jgi:16S rRNA processing protein RimM